MWRALVLSGGGAKGEFQIGALQYLVENTDWQFDFLSGVSVGALNVALLAQEDTLREGLARLVKIWDSIQENRDVYTGSMTFGSAAALFTEGAIAKDSVFNSRPLAKRIRGFVRWDRFRKPFAVGVVSLTDGCYYLVTNHRRLLQDEANQPGKLALSLERGVPGSIPDHVTDFILASASMPLLFPPVKIYGHLFMDGGIRNVAPLSSAYDAARKADDPDREILVISTAPERLPRRDEKQLNSGKEILSRGLEIMVHEILENDIKLANKLNALAFASEELIELTPLHVRPAKTLALGTLAFDAHDKRRKARSAGYAAMREALENRPPDLVA